MGSNPTLTATSGVTPASLTWRQRLAGHHQSQVVHGEGHLNAADPHLCEKPDDAFAQYDSAVPMPAGSGEFHNPDFQFDQKHRDDKIDWANGFTRKVIVCFVVDAAGNPTKISLPQSPGAALEAHIKDHIASRKYKPGWYTESYRDRNPKYVPTQMALELRFP